MDGQERKSGMLVKGWRMTRFDGVVRRFVVKACTEMITGRRGMPSIFLFLLLFF